MKAYLQLFIWMMLFIIIIEMVFPDSAYRKYIKLILGCILIYTLLSPIVNLIPIESNKYDNYVDMYTQKLGGTSVQESYEEEARKQQESLKEVYIQGMKQLIEGEFDVDVFQVDLSWSQTDGEVILDTIYMTVGEKDDGEIQIGKIQIGDKSESLGGDELHLKNKIKTCLINFYNVQDCNIYITVQKK